MPRKRNTARNSKKRTKLLQNLGKGMNKWEAGKAAGYAHRQSVYTALNRMHLYLPELLERIDMPAVKVLSLLKERC